MKSQRHFVSIGEGQRSLTSAYGHETSFLVPILIPDVHECECSPMQADSVLDLVQLLQAGFDNTRLLMDN